MAVNSIAGTIIDASGNAASLTPTSNISNTSDIVIDTTSPASFTVGAVTTTGGTAVANKWNSTNTGIDVIAPIADDGSLVGGTIQLQAKVADGTFVNLGSAVSILTKNVNQTVSISNTDFENISNFADGKTIVITSIITDKAGNATTGTESATTVYIDQTAPTITVNALTTNDTAPALAGTIDDSSATISVTVNSVTYTTGITISGNTWTLADNTITTALVDGIYDVAVTATDPAGNTGSDATSNELVIDTQIPTITELYPIDSSYINTNIPTISAKLSDERSGINTLSVTISVNSVNVTSSATITSTSVSYTPSSALPEGNIPVVINAIDLAGNPAGQSSTTFTVDTVKPLITINAVTTPTNVNTQTITGTYTEANIATIYVNSVFATLDTSNKTYSAIISLSEGSNPVTATATDLAENTGKATTNIDLDTGKPNVVSVTPTTLDDADAGSVSVAITFNEAMDITTNPTVTITGLTTSYTATAITNPWSGNTKWTGTFTFVDNNEVGTGTYNISGAKDAVGNVMVADSSKTVAVDTLNPTATVTVGTPIISDSDLIQEVTVNYSEAMSVTAPTIAFSATTGTWTAGTGSWDADKKVWTESFTITDTDAGEEITGVTVSSSDAKDVAGNVEGANTTPAPTFVIDTKNPDAPKNMTVAMNTPPAVDTISGNAGTVEANSTVKVYSDSGLTILIGSGLADENGSFGPIDIGDNLYAIVYVTATDAAGNQSSATSMLNDIAAPAAPTDLVLTDPVNDGNKTTVAITGTGEANANINWTITDKDSKNVSGTGVVDGSGNISITGIDVTTLADGTLTLSLTLTDSAGNVSVAGMDTATKDTAIPNVVNVTSTKADGAYKAGASIDIIVEFNEVVIIDTTSGTPQLELETGTTNQKASYTGGTGTNILTFAYTVQAGDTSGDLDYTGTGALALNGGTIEDEAENSATLTLPAIGATGSLGYNKAIVIDTTAPTGYSVSIDQAYINNSNQTALSFTFANAEVGATYNYSIDDTNGATSPVTGPITILPVSPPYPTITDTNQQISDIDVSTLDDDTLTLTVYLTDTAWNQGDNATDTVVKDTEAPVLNEKTQVLPTPTNDSTPNYTFSSTEAGAITYGESCSSATTVAIAGNNTITFNALADGTYNNCAITVTDSAGNASVALPVSEFTVDTTPPVIVNLNPGNKSTTSDTTPAVSVEFSENGSGVNVSSITFSFSGNKEYANKYAVKSATGVVYNQITPLVAETYEATVTVVDNAGNSATKTWSFIVNPTATTIVLTSGYGVADGTSQVKINAQVLEAGQQVIGGNVNFVATRGNLNPISAVTDSNGTATTYISSTEAGEIIITASYNSSNGIITLQAHVYFSETPKAISVAASPSSVPANGTSESTITATVLDNGVAMSGATVNFTTDLGVLSFGTAVTNSSGQAIVTLTSTDIGRANIRASYGTGSWPMDSWTYVDFTAYTAPDTTPPTATQYPAYGSTNIAINVNPYIDFSEAMKEVSLNNNIRLKKHSDSSIVNATYSISTNENGTTRVTITPSQNLSYNTQYYFYIDNNVEDLAENNIVAGSWYSTYKDSHKFTTIAEDESATTCIDLGNNQWKCSIPLNAGWNLISLPLIPTNSAIANVLSGVTNINNVNTVKYYNSTNETWASYTPGFGVNLTTMEDGKGYWIFMNSADTLTVNGSETPAGGETPVSYQLVDNKWNLIGFKSTIEMTAGDYVGKFTNKELNSKSILWDYKDRDGDGDREYSKDPFGENGNMEPGYGYWLLMK
ncbi:MAG: Ig-like domain-containing protein [bacterium]|nr:Ig-like domain-containing protein [bacterium]